MMLLIISEGSRAAMSSVNWNVNKIAAGGGMNQFAAFSSFLAELFIFKTISNGDKKLIPGLISDRVKQNKKRNENENENDAILTSRRRLRL